MLTTNRVRVEMETIASDVTKEYGLYDRFIKKYGRMSTAVEYFGRNIFTNFPKIAVDERLTDLDCPGKYDRKTWTGQFNSGDQWISLNASVSMKMRYAALRTEPFAHFQ